MDKGSIPVEVGVGSAIQPIDRGAIQESVSNVRPRGTNESNTDENPDDQGSTSPKRPPPPPPPPIIPSETEHGDESGTSRGQPSPTPSSTPEPIDLIEPPSTPHKNLKSAIPWVVACLFFVGFIFYNEHKNIIYNEAVAPGGVTLAGYTHDLELENPIDALKQSLDKIEDIKDKMQTDSLASYFSPHKNLEKSFESARSLIDELNATKGVLSSIPTSSLKFKTSAERRGWEEHVVKVETDLKHVLEQMDGIEASFTELTRYHDELIEVVKSITIDKTLVRAQEAQIRDVLLNRLTPIRDRLHTQISMYNAQIGHLEAALKRLRTNVETAHKDLKSRIGLNLYDYLNPLQSFSGSARTDSYNAVWEKELKAWVAGNRLEEHLWGMRKYSDAFSKVEEELRKHTGGGGWRSYWDKEGWVVWLWGGGKQKGMMQRDEA